MMLLYLLSMLLLLNVADGFLHRPSSFRNTIKSNLYAVKPSSTGGSVGKKAVASQQQQQVQEEEKKKGFSLGALVQLVTMGAGAPSLGEYDYTDEKTGKMFFKLEANRAYDEKGDSLQTKAKYFVDGYVEDDNEVKPPGFFANLLSGGRLQTEYEEKIKG